MLGRYRNARFTASKYGAVALPADVKRLAADVDGLREHATFNPALARLPRKTMEALRRKPRFRNATFVLAARHSYAQCGILGFRDTGHKMAGEALGRHSSVLVLDDALCVLAVARWARGRGDAESRGEDVRLLAHRGRLVATAVLTPEMAMKDLILQRFGACGRRRRRLDAVRRGRVLRRWTASPSVSRGTSDHQRARDLQRRYELVLGFEGEALVASFEPPPPRFFAPGALPANPNNSTTVSRVRNVGVLAGRGRLGRLGFVTSRIERDIVLIGSLALRRTPPAVRRCKNDPKMSTANSPTPQK